jgi:hypothetical protein
VPVFLESGAELLRHFELDAARLSGIINDGVEQDRHVDADDIQLIAMSGMQRSYLQMRVPALRRTSGTGASNGEHASGPNGSAGGNESLEQSLRRYLYDKYLYGSNATFPNESEAGS